MQTPIDFGKEFLNKYFDEKDVDGCLSMLAGDLVWITPEDMHHFLSEGAVLKFLQRSIEEDNESRYVDLISIKSSPSADNIMTVAYEVNLVSREDERPLYLRCSMAICRRRAGQLRAAARIRLQPALRRHDPGLPGRAAGGSGLL